MTELENTMDEFEKETENDEELAELVAGEIMEENERDEEGELMDNPASGASGIMEDY